MILIQLKYFTLYHVCNILDDKIILKQTLLKIVMCVTFYHIITKKHLIFSYYFILFVMEEQ